MVFEKLKHLICQQLDISEDSITEESNIIDDLGADSLDLVDLIMSIEKEFDINIDDDIRYNIVTVGDAVKYIESLI